MSKKKVKEITIDCHKMLASVFSNDPNVQQKLKERMDKNGVSVEATEDGRVKISIK